MHRNLLLLLVTTCSWGACIAQTVTDIDGNEYPTVTIGSQVWMAENLKVTHYQNGDPVPNETGSLVWDDLETGARCYYDNDSAAHAATYGALYNWYAMVDERNVCPEGWHVPSHHEWNVLAYYLDPTVDTLTNNYTGTVGGLLKEAGTDHWNAPNEGATNSSGFTALPGGHRFGGSQFHYLNSEGVWWTSSQGFAPAHGWYRHLHTVLAGIQAITYFKEDGMSCRCVSDLGTLSEHVPVDQPDLRLVPNPTFDRVCIRGLGTERFTARVLDLFGQCVSQQVVTEDNTCLDIRTLAPGVYVVHLTGPGVALRRPLLKQ